MDPQPGTAVAAAGGANDAAGQPPQEGICVAIRARPMNARERLSGQKSLWRCLPAHASITLTGPDGDPLPDRNPGFTFFTYDKVFPEGSSTEQVYQAIGAPIVASVLEGFNGTIFAYGQTSSGKTYTMVGDDEEGEEGVLQLAARHIFQLIAACPDRDFLLRVSFVEIYNENIRDLLDPETPSLAIREDPRKGVYIEAKEAIITDFGSILAALKAGSKHRRVEATAMNERSSRSHTIFRMVVESKAKGAAPAPAPAPAAAEGAPAAAAAATAQGAQQGEAEGAVLVATLNLVDLAGSESVRHTGATGNRAKEGGKINQSLLTLSRVIHALGQDGNVHKGFRDSKLTRILQPSLSGNARMAVVCCITPADKYLEETRSTLQFASRAKMVKTCAVVNEVLDDRAQLRRLKKELADLKKQQKQLEDPQEVKRLEAERQLMTGKMEELENVRKEQAEKIARLKTLILQGGEMMAKAAAAGSVVEAGATGPRRQKQKRFRETWCPGESNVPLPPRAAAKALQGLVEGDAADDSIVAQLQLSKGVCGLAGMGAVPEGNEEEGGHGTSLHNKSELSMASSVAGQQALMEVLKIREALRCVVGGSAGDNEGMEEEEGPVDVVGMVQSLVSRLQEAQQEAAAATAAAAALSKAPVQLDATADDDDDEDDDAAACDEDDTMALGGGAEGDATMEMPAAALAAALAAGGSEEDEEKEELRDQVEGLTGERDRLATELEEARRALEAAQTQAAEAAAAAAAAAAEKEGGGDADDNTVAFDPEMQALVEGAAAKEEQIEELQEEVDALKAAVAAAEAKAAQLEGEMAAQAQTAAQSQEALETAAAEARERAAAAEEDKAAVMARAGAEREELLQRLDFAQAEQEAMMEEASAYEAAATALQEEAEGVKAKLSELAGLLRAHVAGAVGEGAGEGEEAEATLIEALVERVVGLQAQLQARVASVEAELRGTAQENTGLKAKLGASLRRRASQLPPPEGVVAEGDAHERVLKELRRQARAKKRSSLEVTPSPAKVAFGGAEGRRLSSAVSPAHKKLREGEGEEEEEDGEQQEAAEAMKGDDEAEDDKETYGLVERIAEMGEEIEALEAQVEALTDSLAGKEGEVAALAEALAGKDGALAEAQSQVASLVGALEGKESELAAAAAAVEEKAAALLAAEEKAAEGALKAEEALAAVAEKEAELAAASAAVEKKAGRVVKLEAEVVGLKDAVAAAEAAATAAVEKETAEMAVQTEGDVAATEEANSKLQGQLLNERNARAEAEAALGEATAELNAARAELRQAEERVATGCGALEEAQAAARQEKERADGELALREAECGALKEQVGALTQELKRTQETLTAATTAAGGMEADDAGLRKRLSQVQTQLDLATSQLGKAEARVKELEKENNRVIREAEDEGKKLRAQLEAAGKGQAQLSAAGTEVTALKEAHAALQKKVDALKAERDEAEGRANRAADAVEVLEKELEALRGSASEGPGEDVEGLKAALEAAQGAEAEMRAEASQLQVRQKRLQQEVEALRQEVTHVRDDAERAEADKGRLAAEVEAIKEEAAAAVVAAKEEAEAAVAAAQAQAEERGESEEVALLREALSGKEEALAGLQTELESAQRLAAEVSAKLSALQQAHDAVATDAAAAKKEAEAAEASRSELLKELNALFEAKFEAEGKVTALEDEVDALRRALRDAKEASSAGAAEEAEALRQALAQKEGEFNAVHGECYRVKRELSELKEAAEAAEEAMGQQAQELARLRAEGKAKDERIKKLDAVKLTTEQVGKLKKIKEEHAAFSAQNKKLKQELEALKQQAAGQRAAEERGASEALAAQSQTIAELMAARDTLQEKLEAASATARKLELERLSVRETLAELPASSAGLCHPTAGGDESFELPEDLGVAVGMLVERATARVAEEGEAAARAAADRALLLKEVETLTTEKEGLKARLAELQVGAAGAVEAEGALQHKWGVATKQVRALEEQVAAAEAKLREREAGFRAAEEETSRSIRFLEKENLELMMEIKALKEQIIRLTAEADALRAATAGAGAGGKAPLAPLAHGGCSSTGNVVGGMSVPPPAEPIKTVAAAAVPAAAMAVADKENGPGGVVVGEALLRARSDDETAPPFRSLNEDDTVNANSQCKQS